MANQMQTCLKKNLNSNPTYHWGHEYSECRGS